MVYSNLGHIFLSFLFFNMLLCIFYSNYKRGKYYIKKAEWIKYIVLFILFGTLGGGEGDYYHYKEIIEQPYSLADIILYRGIETQYIYLSYLVGGNYNLWRFILFSIQFIGMGWFLYRAKLNTYPILLSFTSLCLVTSVYGRAFWGAIFFFMGVYLLIEKKNPFYLIVIALCYISHTSNLVLIALLPFAFIKIKKWHIVVILILFGTIVAVFKDTFTDFLGSGGFEADEAEHLNDRLQSYGNKEATGYFGESLGETLGFVLRYVPILSILFTVLIISFKNKNILMPYRSIFNISFGLVILSLIILVAAIGGGTIFYRILGMTMFPVSILLPYIWDCGLIKKKRFNTFIYLFILCTEYSYFKDMYYALANGNY